MARMADMIKQSAVPAAVMRTASRGALSVPADEMLEILVFLTRNPVFGQDARMTLAVFDEAASIRVVSSSTADPEVLAYFWVAENRRPKLMPALIENLAIGDEQLMELASEGSREVLDMLLASPRVQGSRKILAAMAANERLTSAELQKIQAQAQEESQAEGEGTVQYFGPDSDAEVFLEAWTTEHASEIAAEEGKAFELVLEDKPLESEAVAAPVATTAHRMPAALEEKYSVLQKVSRMTVTQRIKTAFLGDKEVRSILVRDNSRLVQSAVISSPKLTDQEVESYSAARNVHENVYREISRNRRFIKNYIVIRNLVNNPRCPLDISLTQIKSLLVGDLKELQRSRDVPDTIRKIAMKLYREKTLPGGGRR